MIGQISAEGATYKALEFGGDIENISISGRFTLANISVEAGAKAGLFPADDITRAYLKLRGREEGFQYIYPDPDAEYEQILEVDLSSLKPMVSKPHTVDNVAEVDDVAGTRLNQVFIGSCTNARLDDLAIVADIFKGKKCHASTRVIVTPASKEVYLEASRKGYIEIFIEAGATVGPQLWRLLWGSSGYPGG